MWYKYTIDKLFWDAPYLKRPEENGSIIKQILLDVKTLRDNTQISINMKLQMIPIWLKTRSQKPRNKFRYSRKLKELNNILVPHVVFLFLHYKNPRLHVLYDTVKNAYMCNYLTNWLTIYINEDNGERDEKLATFWWFFSYCFLSTFLFWISFSLFYFFQHPPSLSFYFFFNLGLYSFVDYILVTPCISALSVNAKFVTWNSKSFKKRATENIAFTQIKLL